MKFQTVFHFILYSQFYLQIKSYFIIIIHKIIQGYNYSFVGLVQSMFKSIFHFIKINFFSYISQRNQTHSKFKIFLNQFIHFLHQYLNCIIIRSYINSLLEKSNSIIFRFFLLRIFLLEFLFLEKLFEKRFKTISKNRHYKNFQGFFFKFWGKVDYF